MAVYSRFLISTMQNALANRRWRAALLVDAYEQNVDAESVWAQIQGYEIHGPGYVAGGIPISLEVGYDPDSDTVLVGPSEDQIDFGVLSAEDIGALVIYSWTGVPATSQLLVVDVFDSAMTADGQEFIYYAPPEGLIPLTISDPTVVTEP